MNRDKRWGEEGGKREREKEREREKGKVERKRRKNGGGDAVRPYKLPTYNLLANLSRNV